MNYEEMKQKLGDNRGVGAVSKKQVAPEDEIFHSVYISGKTRTNEMGQVEEAGKLQIRGVETNLDEVFCIILTSKLVNVNERKINGKQKLHCFSYRDTDPAVGLNGKVCPLSGERDLDTWCKGCRTQLLVIGILTDVNGKPKLTENKKPIYVFVRAKGVKYSDASDYLFSLSELNIDPYFDNADEDQLIFEKNNINPMRVVTKIFKGTANSSHGQKDVFNFEICGEVPLKLVERLIKLNMEIVDEFDDKFNWGKRLKKKPSRSSSNQENTSENLTSNDFSMDDSFAFDEADTKTSKNNNLNFDDDIPF